MRKIRCQNVHIAAIAAISLPSVSIGAYIVFMALRGAPSGNLATALCAAAIGAVLVALGLWFLQCYSTLVIDPAAGTWRHVKGLIPGRRKIEEGRLSDINRVTIRQVIRRHKNDITAYFPVHISGPGISDMEVYESTDMQKSRAKAETFAKLLNVKLFDRTVRGAGSGRAELVLEPADLDISVRSGKSRLTPGEEPPEPQKKISSIQDNGETLLVAFPMLRYADVLPGVIVMTIVFLGWEIFVHYSLYPGFPPKDQTAGNFLLLNAVALLPGGLLGWMLLQIHFGIDVIQAGPGGVTHLKVFGPLKFKNTLSAEEIEDVEMRALDESGEPEITVRSDRKMLRFGITLPKPEMRWVAYRIRRAVVGY